MKQATVLLYNMEEDRQARIAAFAEAAGISAFAVPVMAYLQPLGALCGVLPFHEKAYEGENFEGEMMYMAHLGKGQLSAFLDAFHQHGEAPVKLKAMMTENNAPWDSLHLRQELGQELAFFRRLHQQAQYKADMEAGVQTRPEPTDQQE